MKQSEEKYEEADCWNTTVNSGSWFVVARKIAVHDLVQFVVRFLALVLVTALVSLFGAATLSRLMAAAASAAVSVVWVAELSSVAAVQGGLGVGGLEQRRVYRVVSVHCWAAPEIVLDAETHEGSRGAYKGVDFQVSAVAWVAFAVARSGPFGVVWEVYEKAVFLDAVLFAVPGLGVTFIQLVFRRTCASASVVVGANGAVVCVSVDAEAVIVVCSGRGGREGGQVTEGAGCRGHILPRLG